MTAKTRTKKPLEVEHQKSLMELIESDMAHMVENFCGVFHLSYSESGLPDCVSLDAGMTFQSPHDFRVIACFPKQGGGEVIKLARLLSATEAYKKGFRWTPV